VYVYIWKHNDTPFYVGMSKTARRANPMNSGGRGWLCKQTLEKIGPKNVVVELRVVETQEAAAALERSLIELYGRLQCGTGPLTNLRPGGEGVATMTAEGRAATSARMKRANPMHNPEVLEKAVARMRSPDVVAAYSGSKNPAKRPEVRAKLLAKWQDPEYVAKQEASRKYGPKHTDAFKQAARDRLMHPDNPMRTAHVILNTDPEIHKKRVTALRNPETRAKIAESMRKRWAERKAITQS
jgi:hypothetical protein